ncbi:MAG: hypothetical protein QE280_02380 [Caulobacter sp.]|nr:hypothetical protein [Caulobacter sp.]
MRAAVMGGLILAISGGLAASAQSPEMDFRVQARCLAVYEAAATAVEAVGGDKPLVKLLDRNRERTALALAARRDVPASVNPAALQEAEAQNLEGQSRDSLVAQARTCDKALGYGS